MTPLVPYINCFATLSENVFNTLGYLPKDKFPRLNAWSVKNRLRFGVLQTITGVALVSIGLGIDCFNRKPEPAKYLTFTQQMISLGILHLNHGIFNVARSYAEKHHFGIILCPYDFYGRKFLPSLAPSFDLQGKLFDKIRRQLDRIHFITLLPFEFSYRE